ncbi:hypothetical protein MBLNU230_g1749t1 [Neophaeotheca triangularis]
MAASPASTQTHKTTPTTTTMSAPNFTTRERELMCIAWQCMKVKPEVDYEKMATMAKFKNAQTARSSWGPVMRKILAGAAGEGAGEAAATPTPKKRKAGAATDADAGETPSKKNRKKATPRKPEAKGFCQDDEDEVDDTEAFIKPELVED